MVRRSYRLIVDLSGIIFVILAVTWAGYLIPKALKHHDEVARTRSVDRFSNAMRVLARREPVNRRDARLVVTPQRTASNPRVLVPSATSARSATARVSDAGSSGAGLSDAGAPVARPVLNPARRAAAKAAARRRRRILSFLLFSDLVVGALVWFVIVPRWSLAIPTGLTVLYLVLCRTQVRRDKTASWDRELAELSDERDEGALSPRRAARIDVPHGTPAEIVAAVRNEQGFEEFSPFEDTMSIPAVVDAVSVPTEDGGSLWDPLPVTLPTYVGKPKAKRTVRTIDLGEPGTWTSGRTDADTKLVQKAADATATATTEEQHAVGS
ncbi:MAG: hypothetical protein QOI81_1838 [Actinomycetota bacterium]|nr:hypothetical protein [Actinomycetota bacterium]